MTFLAEHLGKVEKTQLHQLAEELELDVNDKAFEGLKGWRLVLSLLLEWEKKSRSRKRSTQELARIFTSIHARTHGPSGNSLRSLYVKLARKLDFRGMIGLHISCVLVQTANNFTNMSVVKDIL